MNHHLASGTLPWTKSCFVCGQDNPRGLRLKSKVEHGKVVLDYTPRESDLGWKSAVHGGIAATLLDEVMTWTAIIAVRHPCVAAEMTVRFKRPIAVGRPIRAEARPDEVKSRMVLASATLSDDQGLVVASATGKYMPMNSDLFPMCSEDFVADGKTIRLDQLIDLHKKDAVSKADVARNPIEPQIDEY